MPQPDASRQLVGRDLAVGRACPGESPTADVRRGAACRSPPSPCRRPSPPRGTSRSTSSACGRRPRARPRRARRASSSGVSSSGDTGARQDPSACSHSGHGGRPPVDRLERRVPPWPAPARGSRRCERRSPSASSAASSTSARLVVGLVVVGALAELEQDELALGVEAQADEPGPEQRHRGLVQLRLRRRERRTGARGSRRRCVEERDRLGREQRDLLLLDQHGELRVLGAGLDVEGTLAGLADRAGRRARRRRRAR